MPDEETTVDDFFNTPAVAETTTELPAIAGDMGNLMQQANFLAQSTIIPEAYRNKPANCLIALEFSNRIGCNFLTAAQSLFIIQGRPSWSSQFLISAWNTCGRYTPIKYKMFGEEEDGDAFGCIAYSKEIETGELVEGPKVTVGMANGEGWTKKNGSKWIHLKPLMIRYRAATFLIRLYAPELTFGLHTREEVEDITNVTPQRESLAENAWKEKNASI
jgi:hypothetical protein